MAGPIYFAIGDIHGEAERLARLHAAIFDRLAFEGGGPAKIVHLGDYVDRGPDSRGVIQRIMNLQAKYDFHRDIEIIALMGNHEEMMLNQKPGRAAPHWLDSGGLQTLASYASNGQANVSNWTADIPEEHLRWLSELPSLHHDEERRLAFVHAGIDPAAFPNCRNEIRLWTRAEKFMNDAKWPRREELQGLTVIHGHTPTNDYKPDASPRRINIDTGACYGGPLTAVMLKEDADPQFLRIE